MRIDAKYTFVAVNPTTNNYHTHEDAFVVLAKDKAFLAVMPAYLEKLIEFGADERQIAAAEAMMRRIISFQSEFGSKVPDCGEAEFSDIKSREENGY